MIAIFRHGNLSISWHDIISFWSTRFHMVDVQKIDILIIFDDQFSDMILSYRYPIWPLQSVWRLVWTPTFVLFKVLSYFLLFLLNMMTPISDQHTPGLLLKNVLWLLCLKILLRCSGDWSWRMISFGGSPLEVDLLKNRGN